MIAADIDRKDSPLLRTVESAPERIMEAADESVDEGFAARFKSHRLVPLLVWAVVIATFIFAPLKIISYGYLPVDDALRHAAKAVTGRDWSEIVVIQDQFKLDHNPGWHWILGQVHQMTDADTGALVLASMCALALAFTLAPLGWMRRPEAWVGSLFAILLVYPGMLARTYSGRPFILSMVVTMTILALWRNRDKATPAVLGISTALFALATWVHGSWYLFVLVAAAFALAGRWKASLSLAGCWLAGSFFGAVLTGHPVAFLWNAIHIAINCFGHNDLQRVLVTEFRPSDGAPVLLGLTAALLLLRAATGTWSWKVVNNPIFILFLLGWGLGFRVTRFHDDWAMPALALWVAFELQGHLQRCLEAESVRRLVITGGLCAAFFFAFTGDLQGRWTGNLTREYLVESDPEMNPWLPEDGGILYSSEMRVFYDTFFKNPNGKWKYILGFESTFMPPEDFSIHRKIQWNNYAFEGFQPWVDKMRPEDRLVIRARTEPSLKDLEWKLVARDTWVGRLPREGSPVSDDTPKLNASLELSHM